MNSKKIGAKLPSSKVSSTQVFKTKHGYYACDHRDPNSQSLVIARGIVGEKDGHSTIASPLIKRYTISLRGECVSGADYTIGVYPLEVRDGDIYLQV